MKTTRKIVTPPKFNIENDGWKSTFLPFHQGTVQYAEGCDGSIGPGAWLQPNRWRVEGFHLICRNLMESIYNKLWFFLKLSKTHIFKSLVHTCHPPILLVGTVMLVADWKTVFEPKEPLLLALPLVDHECKCLGFLYLM